MGCFILKRFQLVRLSAFALLFFCQSLWASQPAVVIVEKAVIYSDQQMSSAVGFVRKGKRINVGLIARNHAQVYPILVSGKVAYIRVLDVSTETQEVGSKDLIAERFKQSTRNQFKTTLSASVLNYSSQLQLKKPTGKVKDKAAVNWTGVSLHGGSQLTTKWDLDVYINYLSAKVQTEEFNAVELGFGTSYRLVDLNRFSLKWQGQLLLIPFTSYALGERFRVNGFGYGAGSGLNLSYRFGRHFGIEGFGGFYYTKLTGFKPPKPYKEIDPSFVGTRAGVGLTYQF